MQRGYKSRWAINEEKRKSFVHAEYPQQIFPLEDSFAHGNFVLIMEMRKIVPNDGDVLSKNEYFSFKI